MGFAGVWGDPDVAKPDKLNVSPIYTPQGSSKKNKAIYICLLHTENGYLRLIFLSGCRAKKRKSTENLTFFISVPFVPGAILAAQWGSLNIHNNSHF
jgi:hypothetical protein